MSVTLELSPAARELVQRALWVRPSSGRHERLRAAVAKLGESDWACVPEVLERHGVLVLAARNLGTAGASLPDEVAARLGQRATALGEDALRFRFTLERCVSALSGAGVEATLLKGASLGLDTYPDAALRGQGDLDLLVEPEAVPRAVAALEPAGLLSRPQALPLWWYRRAHFHVALEPANALLRPVEVHWALQHPSLLLTPDSSGVLARRTRRDVAGVPVHVLGPWDRLLHLATHLISHARGAPGEPDAGLVLRVLAEPSHPLRLKWILDVHAELERLGDELDVDALVDHARTWGAAAHLRWVVLLAREGIGLEGAADQRASELLQRLTGAASLDTSRVSAQRARPLSGLDFREEALLALPRWVLPPSEYLARRYGGAGLVRRGAHAARVLSRAAVDAALLLPALAGRALARGERERSRRANADPERVLELATEWRRLVARARG